MTAGPVFTTFVSSVPGRLVARWGTSSFYFGARMATPDELAATGEPIVWNQDAIVPLTAEYAAKYARELEQAFAMGDLRKRSAEDFEKAIKAAEAEEAKRLALEAAAAAKASEASSSSVAEGAPASVEAPPSNAAPEPGPVDELGASDLVPADSEAPEGEDA